MAKQTPKTPDDRVEIRLIFKSPSDPLFKKIVKNAKKQKRSPANETILFLEENYK